MRPASAASEPDGRGKNFLFFSFFFNPIANFGSIFNPDRVYSRMRLAKGFFLPVLVAQNADLSLPSGLVRVSGGSSPEVL